MFSSSIYSKESNSIYPKILGEVIAYLQENFEKIKDFENGRYNIDGDNVFMNIGEATTQEKELKKPESHKKYIDVQLLLEGEEVFGFGIDDGSYVAIESNEEKDVYFYEDIKNESFIKAKSGDFNIFFPADIHRPGVKNEESSKIKKAVVKVLYSLCLE